MKGLKNKGDISLPFGPIHPASSHFYSKLEVEGEEVVELEPDPGYFHRGFEKLMEYRNYLQNSVLVDRICVFDPFSNEMGYVKAVEKISGIEVPKRAEFIRTIMAELGRVLSHITWLGLMSASLGFESAEKIAFGDREKVLRLNEMVTGGRVYPCYFVPGGVREDLPEDFKEKALKKLDYLEKQLGFYDSFIFKNSVFIERTEGIGVLQKEKAIALGATGPNLRASGVKSDLRKDKPYSAYEEVNFDVITGKKGDCYSRALCRRKEISESIKIVKQLLEKMPEGKIRNKKMSPNYAPKKGSGYFSCEAARGELGFYIVSDKTNKPYRAKVRGPSFSHILSVFPYLGKGVKVADIPVIYWSLDPCPADMDR